MSQYAPLLKEYEILSEDRRRAVDIFLKGILLGAAFAAVLFKYLLDSTGVDEGVVAAASGVGVAALYQVLIWKSAQHDELLNTRLNELANELGLAPVIATRSIFRFTWVFVTIVSVAYLYLNVYFLVAKYS